MGAKVALVTGASRGIGLAIATMLTEEGYDLTVVSRTAAKLELAAAGLAERGTEIHAVAADLAEDAEITRVVDAHRERFGRLDLLVNNAGLGIHGPIDDYPTKYMDLQLALDLRAPMIFYREAIDLLRAAGAEHRNALVVNVSSTAGKHGVPGIAVYSAVKHGVVGFTEAMNRELSEAGVKSCALCPGFVDTELADYSQNPVPPEQMIRPADVAESVRVLLRLSPTCVLPEIALTRPGADAVVWG
jgi:NAD(P)-dependent dehydrogenase (short-subunit alcohol dehydrogenase family)